jgi:hypothetical protein
VTVRQLVLLLGMLWLAGASAQDTASETTGSSLVFGPKLRYYPMECQEIRGCRLECFQSGVSVVTRGDLSVHDEIRLVVNTGISDEILPRWIEVKPVAGDGTQTILLTRDTVCDFRGLLIEPRNSP